MEVLREREQNSRIQSVVFDFDGTISTLRCGWEAVMKPLMIEAIAACPHAPEMAELEREVEAYIDESTGIQTIFQMKWLAERVAACGGAARDPWDYKDEYNVRLMKSIEGKKQRILSGAVPAQAYLIAGSVEFLRMLKEKGVRVYVASGTDHPDVVAEARALGVYDLFDEVAGAPVRQEKCSKEAVLRMLAQGHGLQGSQVAVIGDGKVEIQLAKEMGALAIGLATNEEIRSGVNPVKRSRLIKAGADLILGDFTETDALTSAMGI